MAEAIDIGGESRQVVVVDFEILIYRDVARIYT